MESVSWRWFDFELLQFAHYWFVPGWKHAVFRVVWFLLLLKRCWKLYKKKRKRIFKSTCDTDRCEIRRESSILARDLPYFPSLREALLMNCESLDTILATKATNSRRQLQPPQPWPGRQADTWQALPRPSFHANSMLSIGFPESLRSSFPAFPLPPGQQFHSNNGLL